MSTGTQLQTPPAAKGGPFRRLAQSRWFVRSHYALDRLAKCLKVVEVRTLRKWLVKYYYSRRDTAPPPSRVTVRVTNSCNLRCVQCGQWGEKGVYLRPGREAFPKEMTTDEWKTFLARMAPVCPHIYIFGGEPFLRKDLLEIVRFANQKGMITGVNTNGSYLAGKGEEIVRSGLDYLIASIDGPHDVNNQIRVGVGKQDGYAAMAAGVAELVRAKQKLNSRYPLIEMFMTLTEQNQAHILETAKLAMDFGGDYFSLTLGVFTTPELARTTNEQFKAEFGVDPHFYDGFVRSVTKIDTAALAASIREVERMWGTRYKQYPPFQLDLEQYFKRPEQLMLPKKQCLDPWATMQILSNGDVAYCSDFAELVTGNVRDTDPLELWNNPTARSWRHRIRTKGIFPAESRCCDYFLY